MSEAEDWDKIGEKDELDMDQPHVEAIHKATASLRADGGAETLYRAAQTLRNPRHIPLMHPPVALALADLLLGIVNASSSVNHRNRLLRLAREIIRVEGDCSTLGQYRAIFDAPTPEVELDPRWWARRTRHADDS